MKLSWTLTRYLAAQFAISVLIVLGVMLSLTLLLDIVELLREFSGRADVPFPTVVGLAILKQPHMVEELLPFCFLFGGILAFTRMTRNQELVVVRASGVSVWQFLYPGIAVAVLGGIFAITVYDPIASTFYRQFENAQAAYVQSKSRLLQVSPEGLWLRQGNRESQSVIHALGVKDRGRQLEDVIIFTFEGDDRWVGRIDAESATLEDGFWSIQDARLTSPNEPTVNVDRYELPTTLTYEQIQDSFATPDTMSIWALPGFIALAEAAGFSALRHRLHWHSVVATPVLLCAMVLIAASFSLRLTRLGGISRLVIAGIISGFVLYFASDLATELGLAGNIPVVLAAWAPASVALLLGLTTLFYLEDG